MGTVNRKEKKEAIEHVLIFKGCQKSHFKIKVMVFNYSSEFFIMSKCYFTRENLWYRMQKNIVISFKISYMSLPANFLVVFKSPNIKYIRIELASNTPIFKW